MVLLPLALAQHLVPASGQRPKDQYTLVSEGEGFVIAQGARKATLPRKEDPVEPKTKASFRRDRRWAVWDERGLTTRDGEWTYTDRLAAVPLSPKAQDAAAIAATRAKIRSGRRSREAGGLSGARRLGTLVYFLPRWDESDGKRWLEALVVVDLSQPHPKARLLGTFGGLSLGQGKVDDRLGLERGAPAVAINREGAWGLATYDAKRSSFAFEPRGFRLLAMEDDRIVETTPYGTTLVGRQEGTRTIPWLETRGEAEFVPGPGPVLVRLKAKTGDRLRNAVSGAELRLAADASVRRTALGLLVAWPAADPRSARLVDPSRFEERARWEKGTRG